MFRRSHLSPFRSNQPGYGARPGASTATDFPGRYGGDHPERTQGIRWIYLHMIEEYARHNGHADLIRERIDGVTGD